MFVGFDADGNGFVGLEGLEGAEVGGVLDEDGVAGIEEDFGDEIEALLGAVGDEYLVRGDFQPDGFGEVGADPLAQGKVALGDVVLEGGWAVFGEERLGGAGGCFDGKQLGRGQAASEGDDIGGAGDFEDFADGARLETGGALGEGEGRRSAHGRSMG